MLKYIRTVMNAKRDQGASAVEYGLMVAAIAAIIVAIVFALGGVVKNIFTKTCNSIDGQAASTSTTAAGNCK
jgi:pilus assembly protein Flp/PilA